MLFSFKVNLDICVNLIPKMAKSDKCLIFIREIRRRPVLWDLNNPQNTDSSENLWGEISRKFNCSVDQVKNKWASLRSQFRKNFIKQLMFHKTNPGVKFVPKWKYFLPLLFLKSQMKNYRPKSSQVSREISQASDADDNNIIGEMMKEYEKLEEDYEDPSSLDPENDSQNQDEINTESPNQQTYDNRPSEVLDKFLKSFENDMITLEKEKIDSIDMSKTDEDVLFLHSLLPYLKSLDSMKKLILRTKIQKLMCDFIVDLDDSYFNAVKSYTLSSNETNGDGEKQDKISPLFDDSQIMMDNEEINSTQEEEEDNLEEIIQEFPLKFFNEEQGIWLLNIDD